MFLAFILVFSICVAAALIEENENTLNTTQEPSSSSQVRG